MAKETITIKKPAFVVDEIVYLKTDPYQEPHMVVAIVMDNNGYSYRIRSGGFDPSEHQANELSTIRNMEIIPKYESGEED